MKKILSIALSVIILFAAFPLSASAEGSMPELKNGVYQIESYDQLRNVAAVAYNGVNAKLIQDITCTSNDNDYMIEVQPSGSMRLDLNGFTLSRSAYSLDETLISVEYESSLFIYDSSKEQTGTCVFDCKAPVQAAAVLLNNGGQLFVESGNYILKTTDTYAGCGVITGDRGYTHISGGNFDGAQATAGVGIKGRHWGYMYDSPVFVITGGTFYGKGGISLSPYGDYIKFGSFYPTAFVLGGEFHLVDPNQGSGFAYCNNEWGDIFVGGGTIPAYSLNGARDYTFGEGCVKKLVSLENPKGVKSGYYQVTPPTMIFDTVSQPDINEILLQRLMRQWLNKYKKRSALVENNASLFDTLEIPRMIYVDRTQEHAFQMNALGIPQDGKYRWLVADSYDVDTQWTHLSQYDNNTIWVNRPEEATTKYYRLEVTPVTGDSYTDDVMIVFEASAKTTVLSDISFYLNNPKDAMSPTENIYTNPTTIGGYQATKIQWYDKTANKAVGTNETFIAEHHYEAIITLKALEGFAFSVVPPVRTLCNATLCKVEESNDSLSKETVTVIYDAGLCPTVLSVANLKICPPVAGIERDLYPQVNKQHFSVDSVIWKDKTEDRDMTKGELFINGHRYTVEVWLKIDDGFTFANNGEISQVKALVNGEEAPVTTAYEQSLDQMIVVNYDFGVCDSVIDQVNVVDVYEPLPGENPVSYAWAPSDQYAVTSVFWYGPNGQLWDSDTFEEGVTYEVAIQLLPIKHDTQTLYSFDPNLRAYINEAPADKTELVNDSLIIYATYICAPKSQPNFPYGDVNNDGNVDAKDALEVLKFAVGKTNLTAEQQLLAEVVGDSNINAKDALEILKYAVNKIDAFPIEK